MKNISTVIEPLTAARLKLKWANQHISNLQRQADEFLASGSYKITVEDDARLNQRSVCVKVSRTIPPNIGLIIGDAIHNMRAALDLMTWEVIIPYDPKPKSSVQFPVGNSARHFSKEMLPSRKINIASEKIARAFESLQAYEGGDGDNLWRIHHLDVTDKHQVLMPAINTVSLRGFSPAQIDPGYDGVAWRTHPDAIFTFYNVKAQNLVAWPISPFSVPVLESRKRLKQYINRQQIFAIAFGVEAEPFAKGLVIPKLTEFSACVGKALDTIATAMA